MGAVSFLFLAFLGGYGIAGNIKVIKEEENKIWEGLQWESALGI